MSIAMTCPKCRYTRQPEDIAPEEECPKCGIVYAKVTPRMPPPAPKIPTSWQKEEAPPLPERETVSPLPRPEPIQFDETHAESSFRQKLMIDCEACGGQLSTHAQTCPHCGHPNQESPNRAGNTAGLIALTLAVSALWMPYFGAPLLIPAAIGAIIIAGYLRAHPAPIVLAAVLVTLALIGVYQTSKEIRKAGEAMEKNAREAQTELEIARKRMERFQREFGR